MTIEFFVNLFKDIEAVRTVKIDKNMSLTNMQNARIESIALRIFGCLTMLFGTYRLNSTLNKPSSFFDLGVCVVSLVAGYDLAIMGSNRGDAIARLDLNVKNETLFNALNKGISFFYEALNLQDPAYLYKDTLVAKRINEAWNKNR
ncbi:MAG TPA: hypothetical protein PLC42_00965 [Parachlamydiaceae bacterium]|nr:hypothetical protein [Parachlamydiaceae bacterium]